MGYVAENPLIVQGDRSVLAEVHSPHFAEARDALARFAELVKSPEHIHTYRITPLSIWNAVAAGMQPREMAEALVRFAKYDVPAHVLVELDEFAHRYGRLKIARHDNPNLLWLVVSDVYLAEELNRRKEILPLVTGRPEPTRFLVPAAHRGRLKQELIKVGWPAEDLAGYVEGERLVFNLRTATRHGLPFGMRAYQSDAVEAFWAQGLAKGGSGAIVMPCGAGKTIIGMGVMAKAQVSTLIITTSVTALRQWIDELLDKTDLVRDLIGEYSGHSKDIRPVTVATYQILTHRKRKEDVYPHFALFNQRDWGLIIYDEVHVLPAPVFSITAEIQARRRLGLTATLVREDGREDDVFALIGPKKADVPWKDLEQAGWIAPAVCREVRVSMPPEDRLDYALAQNRTRFRIASENALKMPLIERILARHSDEPTLVIGQYISQLQTIARRLKAPIITGSTPQGMRDDLYSRFKAGRIPVLVVSKVANFAVDLPDARVAVQVSGTFGSRQEEAQRLGRILRPKADGGQAFFYTLVTRDTTELEFAQHRQLFLTEQGYAYEILDAAELDD